LSLEDEVPNHSTFSKNRHGRFRDSDLFRWLFNEVLRRCMDAGLVKGEGFAVDASIIKADASRQRGVPGDEPVNWSDPALSTRAVREYIEALDEEALAETLPKRLSLTDPQAPLDRSSRWPSVLRLLHELSDRYRARRDHGCGTHTGSSNHRSREHQDDDRTGRSAVRHQAGAPHWRYRLRYSSDAGAPLMPRSRRGSNFRMRLRWANNISTFLRSWRER